MEILEYKADTAKKAAAAAIIVGAAYLAARAVKKTRLPYKAEDLTPELLRKYSADGMKEDYYQHGVPIGI